MKGDLVQLAHYWRTLEAAGAAARTPWAGVLGSEGNVVWFRLGEVMWRNTDRAGVTLELNSLGVYDPEFAQRLAITVGESAHRIDPDVPLLVEPARIGDCGECTWRRHCGQILHHQQDISLLPGVNLPQWRALGSIGAATLPELARLGADVGVPGLADHLLNRAVDEARAWLGSAPAYRRHGVAEIIVPHADIELDGDMENVADGADLWGVWVTDGAGTGLVEEGYLAFVDWNPEASIVGAIAFERFWTGLVALQDRCADVGARLVAYCRSAGAENRWLQQAARRSTSRTRSSSSWGRRLGWICCGCSRTRWSPAREAASRRSRR